MFWYEEEVQRVESEGKRIGYSPDTIFFGSSSFRMWNTLYQDFHFFKPVNLGFGGSTMAACVWFFERIMNTYDPKRILVYAGDNDLGDGRHPEEVFIFYQALSRKIADRFGSIPYYYLSMKPSPARWNLIDQFSFTNRLIKDDIETREENAHFINIFPDMLDGSGFPKRELYGEDGLHLSVHGYALWQKAIKEAIVPI